MKFLPLALLLLCVSPGPAQTLPLDQSPPILQGVGVEQRLGERVPLDLEFTDSTGQAVRLDQLVHDRPVLLTLVYYGCPMLCTTTLTQLSRSLNALSESAGEQFDVITVSFNPRETPDLAAAKKRNYLQTYRRPSAEAGWHFLTGSNESIDSLCRAVGFSYRWDEKNQLYAHAAAVIVLSPQGKISRYFLGVDYPPTDLRDAMSLAGAGSVGAPAEQIFLYCFHYDPTTGKYGLIINRAIQAAGTLTLCMLAGLIGINVYRERRRHKPAMEK